MTFFSKKLIDMPTTIYSSSLITQRSRDKIIAQEVQQRNSRGIPIITPQSGYGAYIVEDKDNGSINEYRQTGSCTTVDKACACDVTPKNPLIPDSIWINHTVSSTSTISRTIIPRISRIPSGNKSILLSNIITSQQTIISNPLNEITVSITGYGTIDWGDGTIESFDSSINVDNTHTYIISIEPYTIKLYGIIYRLYTSYPPESGGNLNYPEVNYLQMNEINNLSLLMCINSTLTNIINFNKCYNLSAFYTGNNNLSIYNILTSFKNLTSLGLGAMPSTVPSIFDCSYFSLLSDLYIPDNPSITNITNMPNGLSVLYAYSTGITGLSSVPLSLLLCILGNCNIDQSDANSITEGLYDNGLSNGVLNISSQSSGTLIIDGTQGGKWTELLARNWFIN